MFCPKCGHSLASPKAGCPNCGASILMPGGSGADEIAMLVPVNVEPFSMIGGYLGLFGLLFLIPGPFAVVFGIIGLRRLGRDQSVRGIGRAWTAIVLGVLESVVILWVVFLIII